MARWAPAGAGVVAQSVPCFFLHLLPVSNRQWHFRQQYPPNTGSGCTKNQQLGFAHIRLERSPWPSRAGADGNDSLRAAAFVLLLLVMLCREAESLLSAGADAPRGELDVESTTRFAADQLRVLLRAGSNRPSSCELAQRLLPPEVDLPHRDRRLCERTCSTKSLSFP